MDSHTNSSEENIPRGCLKLNNKIYPVFEGLNTVGRNPEAVINIKNLNISQQHAIITIVDENSHFISDFKSSNGTTVDNKQLKPLKLYKLLNGASVKFADVFCTYKKLDNNEHVSDNLEETQDFNETFYGANTQAIHLQNSDEPIINEMPTQVMEPAILSTQVTRPKSLNFNEMPTQVFSYNDSGISRVVDDAHDSSSNDSLDFITMQKATQSQGFALNQSDSDTEEQSPVAPVKLNAKNIITSDSEGVQSTPEILPVKLKSSKNILSSDSEGTRSASDTKKNLTDPEQEEESSSQIHPVRTSIKNTVESDSDTDTEEYIPRAERRKSRYVISDDDETDIEDETMNNTDIIPTTQEMPQKPGSSRTSHNLEQSSMDSFRLELSERKDESCEEMKEKDLSSIAQDHISSMDSFRLELSEIKDEEKDLSSIPQDHIYCQDASNEPKTSNRKNNEDLASVDIQKKNSVTEDHIYCRSLEASQENLNLDEANEDSTKPVNNAQEAENLSEEAKKSSVGDGQPPPQTAELTSNDENLEDAKKSDEKGAGEGSDLQNTKEAEKEVDIFDQPTQQLALDFADDDTLSVVGNKESDRDSELTEELIMPTDQKLEVKNTDRTLNKELTKEEQKIVEQNLDGDDETQSIVGDKEADQNSKLIEELAISTDQKLEVKNTEDKELTAENTKEEQKIVEHNLDGDDETQSVVGDKEADQNSKLTEELVISTDQKSEEQQKDEKEKSESLSDLANHDNLDHTTESKNEDDDIFAQPTQQIDFDFVGGKDKADDDDIYLQSTQKMPAFGSSSNKGKVDDEDIYFQPTQQMNEDVDHTSKLDDLYLLPTQKLKKGKTDDKHKDENNLSIVKDHEFALPLPVSSEKKTALKHDEDDDDFLPPTQALEYLHKEDEATTSKQADHVSDSNLKPKEVEDQLEMLFYSQSDHRFVATQQLVDVLEDKNDDEDIIDASMIEENSSLKSKIAKFNSVDSIRMILDEDLEDADNKNKKDETTKAGDNDLESDDSQNRSTKKGKELPKENIADQEQKKGDKEGKRIRKEELKDDGKQSENNNKGRTTRTNTRSNKNDGKETDLPEDASSVKVDASDNLEEKNVNLADDIKKDKRTKKELRDQAQEERDGKQSETDNEGRATRTNTRSKKKDKETDLSEKTSNNKVETPAEEKNTNQRDVVKKDKRTRKEKAEELKDQTQEDQDGKQSETENKGRPARTKTRSKKNDDKETDLSEDGSNEKVETPANLEEKNVNQTDDFIKDKRTRKAKAEELKENNSVHTNKKGVPETGGQGRSTRKGKKGVIFEAENLANTEKENTNQNEDDNVEQTNEKESKTVGKSRPTRKTARGTKDDDNRSDTPVNTEKTEDIKKDKQITKEKTTDKRVQETETDDKIRPVRSSKRVRKDDDKDSESSEAKSTDSITNATEEKESNRRNRGKRKNVESLEEANQTDQSPPETEIQQAGGSATRKRNLKTTNIDSDDEFEPKIQRVVTPKKTPAKQKSNETMVRPETPTTRKSKRTRTLKLEEDEVISVPSTSSVTNEVISISSSSSVSDEPVKKSRRLSANSRAQRNEEEKNKQKEVKGRGRKASVQESPQVLPATPERSKRQLKPKVVFTMMDNPELESLIRQLGGSVVDTVDACTVLVTVSVKRSQKLLCAVGQGKPVCSPQWLHACKKAYSFLDPWDYILVDAEAEKKWNFSLRESLNRSTKTKLLENYTFQLIVNTAADVLKGAIEACGGKCVTRNLAKADTDNKIIVSSSDNKNKYSKIVKQDPSIKVVEAEAIFDGTLRQEFRFDKYLLT